MTTSLVRIGLAAGCFALMAGAAVAQGATLKAGDKAPDFTFSGVMLNGDGFTELKDLRGKVVMLDWWGHH